MHVKNYWHISFPYIIKEKCNHKTTLQNQIMLMSITTEMLCFLMSTHKYSNQVKIYLL